MIDIDFVNTVIETFEMTSLEAANMEIEGLSGGSYFTPIYNGGVNERMSLCLYSLNVVKKILDSGEKLSDYDILESDVYNMINLFNEIVFNYELL